MHRGWVLLQGSRHCIRVPTRWVSLREYLRVGVAHQGSQLTGRVHVLHVLLLRLLHVLLRQLLVNVRLVLLWLLRRRRLHLFQIRGQLRFLRLLGPTAGWCV